MIKARIDRTVDFDAAHAELVGQYTIDAATGVVRIPPVMLEALSIVWKGKLPQLVVVPESIYFDLYPDGGDVWVHPSVTGTPKVDVAFHRDDAGRIIGATMTIAGLGAIRFQKVSDAPVYEPFPSTMLPASQPTPGRAPAP